MLTIVNNDEAGWATIRELRRKYAAKGKALRLRGRHSNRQSLLPDLRKRYPGVRDEVLKMGLRSDVPVKQAERLAVYVM